MCLAQGCHTDQQGVSGGLHEAEMLEVLSGRTDFCYISKAESSRIRVHRTALRHPIVSTSNAESVEVGEDASELSCLREPARPRRSSPSQVQQAANEEGDVIQRFGHARSKTQKVQKRMTKPEPQPVEKFDEMRSRTSSRFPRSDSESHQTDSKSGS